jgi:hypothetical protein
MKKKIFICGALSMTLLSTSCLGSFSAFNSLRDWNDGVTDNKFLDNLIFWALNIVPVYGLFIAGDVLFFNVLEFWTGDNPIAMVKGEKEIQYAKVNGQDVKMTATQNHFSIEVLSGENKGETLEMVYTPENKSWNSINEEGELIKLASMKDGFYMVHTPNGESIQIDPNASREQNLALLQGKVADYKSSMWAEVN